MIDIQSPEAVLARQMASQRTGFAIAGPGPVQSDMFPILEYAAPRAFFLGTGSADAGSFRRTHAATASGTAGKNETLASLPESDAQFIFSDFSTVNGELFSCFFAPGGNAGVPCVFQTPQPTPQPASDGSACRRRNNCFMPAMWPGRKP